MSPTSAPSCRYCTKRLVAELGAAAGYELLQFGLDRVVQRRLLVRIQRLGADLACPRRGVLAALLQPPLVVRAGRQQRPVEALPEPFHRVSGAEEMAAVADFLMRAERQRGLIDLQRRELHPQHPQQLDVDDELLVAADEAALQPSGRVHDE